MWTLFPTARAWGALLPYIPSGDGVREGCDPLALSRGCSEGDFRGLVQRAGGFVFPTVPRRDELRERFVRGGRAGREKGEGHVRCVGDWRRGFGAGFGAFGGAGGRGARGGGRAAGSGREEAAGHGQRAVQFISLRTSRGGICRGSGVYTGGSGRV